MEKRLVIFLLCSVLILTGHMLLVRMLVPPPPPQVAPPAAPGPGELAQADHGQPAPAEDQPAPPEAAPDAAPADAPAAPAAEAAEPVVVDAPPRWLTLGSYAPDSPYQLLLTLSNRGAAIERVELVERLRGGQLRFRDLDRPAGYTGLQCQDTPEGCRVTVVGHGTPAALAVPDDGLVSAGLLPGDVLVQVQGAAVRTVEELDSLVAATRPGETLELLVRRGDGDAAQRLTFVLTLGDRPLVLIHPEARDEDARVASYLLGLHRVGSAMPLRGEAELRGFPSLRTAYWDVAEATDREVLFRYRVTAESGGATSRLELRKRFRISPGGSEGGTFATGYSVEMQLDLVNLGDAAETVSYALDGPTGLPIEGWWYSTKIHPSWGSAGARDVIWRVHDNRHSLRSATQIFKLAQEDVVDPVRSVLTNRPSVEDRTLDYLGVDTQYFAAVMLAGAPGVAATFLCEDAQALPVGSVPSLQGNKTRTLDTTFRFVSPPEVLEAGQTVTHAYHLFLGPKAPALLDQYGLGDIIEYGWFGWIAKPLSSLLHLFYALVHNYGLAIILLTVLVRGAMFPIGRKAARNAQIMQELAPEIKKIKEKYKNDLEKQGQAQRELWKKYNFNPLGGCWLMFLQLPIFIGLYRCLSVDIELRQAPLIPGLAWCSDLAGPDMAWRWQGILPDFLASETGWLGPYLNILPILTIVLFIVQQKMFTPPATDEQTRMQQRMMQYMMIFMGVLFFKVPAGLCVYFIASSVWGIGERKLLPKPGGGLAELEAAQTRPPGAPAATGDAKRSSWLDRLVNKESGETLEELRARRRSRR
ncbi:MAG: YidC/Oxa1 family insertase periplasmic-domain containing protein [Pirellulaceae bacterium]|nr:YidC/Oxa1 family insertase periplasmic-domain containing protein [Pirellulaceae bacterium]